MGVMLVNLSPSDSISATVTISGPTLSGSGTRYQFGLTNFSGTNDYPSWPVSTNTVSGLGNSFTVSVPAYTIIDVLIPTNTPPVLAAIGNQTVNSGHTLSLAVDATDTNLPTPILAFSLLSAPTNATLTKNNNTNATFNWEPLFSQANSTNTISIKVADNSNPSLSATDTFFVIVNPNTPPVLAAIGNQMVNVMQTLSLTVSATDTNLPTPNLAFSLLSAPTGATLDQINNNNATFNWQPVFSQANSTNSVSIKVADGGSPPLSATDTFSVIVNPNTPPVLAAIGNQTVNVGQTVSLTASATDTNQPTPILAFSLLSAPTNATLVQINNTNAAFNLRPAVSQASSTIPISLAVSDNEHPPLSATDNFSVVVNPITLPTLSGSASNLANGQFSVTVSGMVGPDYAILYSTDLFNWSTIFETNSPPLPFTWVDTNASLTNPASYYQVLLGPPLP
jgi:hypothetical protein